jgi:hypothetical protein
MSVFDDIERTLQGGADHLISCFDYLNESTRPEAARVRNVVDAMFAKYPADGQECLKSRLRLVDDAAHKSAFFELALHEIVFREGCRVIAIEPPIAGSDKSPDFLIEDTNGNRFYLEATLAGGRPPIGVGAQRRLDEALTAIETVVSPNFSLSVSYDGAPAKPVSRKRLRKAVQSWVDGLDYDAVATTWEKDRAALPTLDHNDIPGLGLRIQPVPRGRLRGQAAKRAIGTLWPGRTVVVDPHSAITDAVKSKAGRYGVPDLPYIIAVNALSEFSCRDSVVEALFGTEMSVYQGGQWRELRKPDGAWHGPRAPINTRVSAVLSVERLTPWSLAQRRARLTLNPWARQPLANVPFGIDLSWVENERLQVKQGRTISEILSLADGWPEC